MTKGLLSAALALVLVQGEGRAAPPDRPGGPPAGTVPVRVGSIYAAAPWWWGREAPSVALFHAELGRWGEWRTLRGWGRVWVPRVAPGWRPYLVGGFVEDPWLGWRWVSQEPFGWAVYHYGRWGFDPRLGWFWVPGRAFAGHWAELRLGAGWCGWAPLPPPGWSRWGRGHAGWLDWGYPGWVFAAWPSRPHWIAPRPGWRPHPGQMAGWRPAPATVQPAPRPSGMTRPAPEVARATPPVPDRAVLPSPPIELVEPEAFPGSAPFQRPAPRIVREATDGRLHATAAATQRREPWQGSAGWAAGSDGMDVADTAGAGGASGPGGRILQDMPAAQPSLPPSPSVSAAPSAPVPALIAPPSSASGIAWGGMGQAPG
ncbi:DUF6600 domain-containing protein, partial [Thermaurantiacus sp.]